MNINEKIDDAISQIECEMKKSGSYAYLPEIKEILEILKKEGDKEKNKKHAAALGYLTMENFDFSESELGTLLGEIADYFLPPAEDVWK